MQSTTRRFVLAAITTVAVLVPAVGAGASTLTYCQGGNEVQCGEGGGLSYRASGGETNNVTISRNGDTLVLTDTGATISASPYTQCQISADGHTATCTLPATSGTSIFATLADGNDTLVTSVNGAGPPKPISVYTEIHGQAGNDNITGNDDQFNRDFLYGGTGDDTLNGRGGPDQLSDYDFFEPAPEGQTGPFNRSGGSNHFLGGNEDDDLYGGPGVDSMSGQGGDDLFMGETFPEGFDPATGTPVVFTEKSNDAIDGGEGFDSIKYALPGVYSPTREKTETPPATTAGATI